MASLLADAALLEDGFAHNVRITHADGTITALQHGAMAAPGDEHVPGILLPGMANLHSHAFQRAFAGLSEFDGGGGDFWSWREAMYRVADRVTPALCTPIAAWLNKELLKGGYTSAAEFHYVHHRPEGACYDVRTEMAKALAAGAAAAGMGLTILVGVYETAGLDGSPLAGGQRRFRNDVAQALDMAVSLQEGSISAGLALHSLRAVPPASVRRAAEDFAGPIHIHVAEQRAEVEACVAALGAPPVAWLLDNVAVDHRWCLVHATHAEPDEITRAARAGAVIGLCPTTEADLGDGIFRFGDLAAACGSFGIGSDSNVVLDAFQELRLLEYGQRLRVERRNLAAAGEGHTGRALWQQAALGGAQACSRKIGRLAPGYRADFVVIEPTFETADAAADFVLDAAIFAAVRAPARHVMVGGAWIVRDGTHIREAAIDEAYRHALKALAA
ncbi:MAG TPA: formimidoylglutamate deiminase [Acetobacteraceae bacterium]|nr:formimidoylglutamate deiminase [Acetobacteraceae bacterium]